MLRPNRGNLPKLKRIVARTVAGPALNSDIRALTFLNQSQICLMAAARKRTPSRARNANSPAGTNKGAKKTAKKAAGKTARKKSARKTSHETTVRTRATSASANRQVVLHTSAGEIVLHWPEGAQLKELQRRVMEWSHIVRNRRRWNRTVDSSEQQSGRARQFLHYLGITDAERKMLATSLRVSVVIPFAIEDQGWEARILPWEYLLSAGTKDLRTGSLVISRWLEHGAVADPAGTNPSVLFVEGVPKALADTWDFTEEARLVEASFPESTFTLLKSPTRAELRNALMEHKPAVVHFAGFDNHQGLALVKGESDNRTLDGYLMCKTGNDVDPVSADDLAQLFIDVKHKPALVFCNIWNSAARVAPLLISAGANCAIGFQDTLDDALAELFLGSFYQALASGENAQSAFECAWTAVRAQPNPLRGTGITLWRGGAWTPDVTVATGTTGFPDVKRATAKVLASSAVKPEELPDYFSFTVEPKAEISYSLLHNNRDLFDRFTIRKLTPARIDGVQVEVELFVGEGTNPYRQSFSMVDSVLNLAGKVRIALTSNLARSVDELLRTSLYVRVRWGQHDLYSESHPVTLAPIDQWADTDTDRLLLPSFVFPRDAAVRQILKQAEQYVTALRDDPTAGFDGYQSIDDTAENPAADVDNQVQAIWYALIYKMSISYINPPATYSIASQRIRTPTEIVSSEFGTCIDLALLTASCLEAVEIYPVVFLLTGHAFPGYWRTSDARDQFLQRVIEMAANERSTETAKDTTQAEERWYFERKNLEEIRREIKANRLVPLESVGITGRASFAGAIEEAQEYFSSSGDFEAMVDIMAARAGNVTPIPISARP